ncbi:PASTA domain-containing protein [Granulicella tundricola]|uniref:PASTA domain containing protein n=1 Tax=Granulicella tundricola (strain ATCC BAA-1859 / DSM 23138 / MP5ACTX9) TaxID=1198114 RepID=E8X3K9_GRATM|nr:PASTA domain-containing protein [Granulicella tundricola]ADW68200.1 PASTA domain containing protein [Granulicella tundricola MP5ACTX9]
MKRILYIILGGMLMFVVTLFAAFSSMRLAIHGREVDVPSLSGLSDQDAAEAARKLGLNLSVENRFYSAAIPPNHVLSQSPAPGSLVRRGWQVRVTESLGGQQVSIPDVTGQTERPAALVLKRLQLDLGGTSHLPAPGPEGTVLAQSPPANSGGVFGPHVSILVAAPETDAPAQAYVMPAIVGLTISAANTRLATAGLHIASSVDPSTIPPPEPLDTTADPAIPPTVIAPPPVSTSAVIVSQYPAPGHRITHSDNIKVTVAHPADTSADATTPAPSPI